MASFGRERNKKEKKGKANNNKHTLIVPPSHHHFPPILTASGACSSLQVGGTLIAAPPLHSVRIAIKVEPEGESRKDGREKENEEKREKENKRGICKRDQGQLESVVREASNC